VIEPEVEEPALVAAVDEAPPEPEPTDDGLDG
jgi:hypothetical protein